MKALALFAAIAAMVSMVPGKGKSPTAKESAEQALLKVHELELRAHRQTDVKLLMANAQDEFVYVRDGKIAHSTAEEGRARFEKYFKNAKYQVYEDMEPPVVRASDDGTMGWIISRTHSRRTQLDPATGKEEAQEFVYAGVMTYEFKDGKWLRVANVSTFEPQSQK